MNTMKIVLQPDFYSLIVCICWEPIVNLPAVLWVFAVTGQVR